MILLQNKMVVFFPGKICGVHWINYILFTISQYYFSMVKEAMNVRIFF
jgi:hypothetical protein